MDKFSYLSNADVSAVDELYQNYLNDPQSVDEGWSKFFEGFEFAKKNYEEESTVTTSNPNGAFTSAIATDKEFKVLNLINGYRTRGHLFTKTNPVRERRKYSPTLDIENFGLAKGDLKEKFHAGAEIGLQNSTLEEIIAHLEDTYCYSIGIEYRYMRKPEKVQWLQEKLESNRNQPEFTNDERKHMLKKLSQAVMFEQFLHKKFVGQKRFSLEGGEALIPALDAVIEMGANMGIEEFVVGMAHRGRLNVLANIFNKTYDAIFSEFEGKEYEDNLFDGDVKYHLGYTCDIKTDSGKAVKMTLSPNPSHLEAVAPVVEGIARAKVDDYLGSDAKIAPILIHGDAALAGQGIAYEVVQMANLEGYKTGGTIHIVINNQIGFTTNYLDGRSSTYCTDVAKVTLCPVFHVNGDDVEAVVHTIKLALEYRNKYKRDVFVDLLCYRKYGHNEGDEPRFTQPILYKAISKHSNPRDIYLDELAKKGIITKEEAKANASDFNRLLQERLTDSREIDKAKITNFLETTWEGIRTSTNEDFDKSVETGVGKAKLMEMGKKLVTLPSKDKAFFKKSMKLMEDRRKMMEETNELDWGMAETLAYATLLEEGHAVRISGQDVERGTFSHRHAVIKVEDSEEEYVPLKNVSKNQAKFDIYNSLLSEYGVLGFEYGYAMAMPNTLTIWEAQFGDFNNGAQIIIDQFLSAAEDKWRSKSGLVMLLPHGYEGQGSEHSSARLERYLTLCGDNNMQIANCTTPANFFHILRRQLKREFRTPLVVMTPKSLLRHPEAVSKVEDLATGAFQEIIAEDVDKKKVKTVVCCSGKLFYELRKARDEKGADDITIVRLEQLYPFPQKQFDELLEGYPNMKNLVWSQEEPENMGSWRFIKTTTSQSADWELVSRHSSASPASGSSKVFEKRQAKIIEETLNYSTKK
jgi:2-oxoglutarate dehydrogenase E1 component